MTSMSFMEKLLGGTEVKWISLKDIAEIIRGHRVTKSELSAEGKFPVYSGGVTPMGYFDKYNQNADTITIVKYGTAGFVNFITEAFWANDVCYCISNKPMINNKFLFYCLKNAQNHITSLATDAIPAHLPTEAISALEVPIPCPSNQEKSLEIQAEIVRILDTFTELTTELTTELNARKKQYKHYRNQLLSFESTDVEWKPLGNIGEFIRGKRFTKKDYVTDGGVKVIHYGEIYTHYGTSSTSTISQVRSDLAESLRYAETNDVIVASVGETIEDVGKAVAWLGSGKVAIHDDSYAIRHSLNPKYLSYCLQTDDFISEKAKYVSRGKVKRLLIDGISKVRIPIPYPNNYERSLAEQARIVAILDKFDALTNSITEGLPREIELRQKQYEYYRDLLLSFPKPNTEEAA
ncbi:restriction endonuclease subunit S [Vibrio metschnikovii]|nr:restriction endonuclease subunit S [Vibrio metschnikovii]